MFRTRRQFALTLASGVAAAGLFSARGAMAQDYDEETALNVFISPPGKPFRAPKGAPYPVLDWFRQADKNGDGKLDHAEFMADAEAFFTVLDQSGDGVLGPYEIAVYEHNIAPEILANSPQSRQGLRRFGAPRLWRAQFDGGGGASSGAAGPGGGMTGVLPPGADERDPLPPHDIDESGQGASPYSFFNEPEPVAAADTSMRGVIKKPDFMALADRHFGELDKTNLGYLTLAGLPKTAVQEKLARLRHKMF